MSVRGILISLAVNFVVAGVVWYVSGPNAGLICLTIGGLLLILALFWPKKSEAKGAVRIEVLKLLMQGHCTQEEVYEKTGATLDLLVEMQAAGELYLSSSGWVMRERPKNR